MHDAGAVGLGEAVGGLRGDAEERLRRQRTVRENLPQRSALDELHRDELDAVRGTDVVDGDEVRVVQRRSRARLFLEALDPLGVRSDRRGQHLEGDVASEPCVTGAIDLAHPAGSESGDDLERSQARARRKRHESGRILSATEPTSDERVKRADEPEPRIG